MKQKIISAIRKFLWWIKFLFWTKPTSKPEPLKATEVIKNWTIINYHGQKVNLHKNELAYWERMSRKDKRAMAKRFEVLEKKGHIRFETINGVETCINNLDYQARADKKKYHGI